MSPPSAHIRHIARPLSSRTSASFTSRLVAHARRIGFATHPMKANGTARKPPCALSPSDRS
ncbi:MAG TPA: hypothetical protein VFG34_00295 [Sphingopyxis sp.]|nr:hypothetical protein [Sphingopyxis sp.]